MRSEESKNLEVKVRLETYYGRDTLYPVCENALKFAQIAGTKTITPKVLKLIKALGYDVALVTDVDKLGELLGDSLE